MTVMTADCLAFGPYLLCNTKHFAEAIKPAEKWLKSCKPKKMKKPEKSCRKKLLFSTSKPPSIRKRLPYEKHYSILKIKSFGD